MELKHFKFKHYLHLNQEINILAKDSKQAFEILNKHYSNASEYYLN